MKMIEPQPLDICGQGLYSSYSYNYPMDSQQTILDFSRLFEPDLTSEKNVESPLVRGAKNKKESRKRYYLKHKKEISVKQKEYYEKNKLRIIQIGKLNYLRNKDRILIRSKEFYLNNKDKIIKRTREYYAKNKETISKRVTKYYGKDNEIISLKNKRIYDRGNLFTNKLCECGCGFKVGLGSKYAHKVKKFQKTYDLSYEQEQVLIGSLLGDGCISKQLTTYRYLETHCIKQKNYLLWKNSFLNYNTRTSTKNDDLGKGRQYIHIHKGDITNLKRLYDLFYPNNIKRINQEILNKLDSLALSIWFMDDGHYNYQSKIIDIYTLCFGLEGNILIQKWFKTKWNVDCIIREKRDKTLERYHKRYYISFNTQETKKLLKIMNLHIAPSMEYKFNLDENKKKEAKIKERNYVQKNWEMIKEYKHRWYLNDKQQYPDKRKIYYQNNKEKW